MVYSSIMPRRGTWWAILRMIIVLDTNENDDSFVLPLKDSSLLRQFHEHHHGRAFWESDSGREFASSAWSSTRFWSIHGGFAYGVIGRRRHTSVVLIGAMQFDIWRGSGNATDCAPVPNELEITSCEGLFYCRRYSERCFFGCILNHRLDRRE